MIFRKAEPISLLLPQQQRPMIGMMGVPTGQPSAPLRLGSGGEAGSTLGDALGGLRLPGLGGVPRETPAWLAAPDGGTAAVAARPAPTMTPALAAAPTMTPAPVRGGSTPSATPRPAALPPLTPGRTASLSNDHYGNASSDRGTRNNNFTNIRDGEWARNRSGYAGTDGAFARFASPDDGLRAADLNLQSYARRGLNTVRGIINRWSPPTENATSGLVSVMAKRMGIGPDDVLDMNDPGVRARLIHGLVEQETGKRPFTPEQIHGAISGQTTDQASAAPAAPPPVVAEAAPGSGVSRFGLSAGQPVAVNPDGTAAGVVPADVVNPPMGPPLPPAAPVDIRPDPQKLSLIDILSSYLPEQGIA